MGRFILSKLGRLVATLFAVSLMTFMMTALLPGDPVNAILPPTAPRDEAFVAQVREELGLDDPLPVRYVTWLGNAVRGDLGRSLVDDRPVATTIKERLPVTAELAFLAVGLAVLMAIPVGVIGAYKEGETVDQVSSAGVQIALSIPNFIAGLFLIWLLSVKLQLLPATGWKRLSTDGLLGNLSTAILPASALALGQMAFFSRLIRSDMIQTLQEDFVLSARAKGLSDRYILLRHALRPSSLSLVTIVGINIGALLGGTVVIESLFALPGLGFRLINAIFQRDFLVIQGITLFVATAYVVINTLVDMLYLVIDPRIRRG
ncbi:MAG: ABC transporter permease [Acidimicrobiia bacterium]|nr:ABC transporter permease [Acidimicrobiia bacterium]